MQSLNTGFQLDGNQLLFNLDAPARTQNILFTQSNKPQPVIIERIGPNAEPLQRTSGLNQSRSLQFSAVSEDSLNLAVQLAKRDLKKQKEETQNKSQGAKKAGVRPGMRTRSPPRAKIVHSKEHKDKLKKRQQRTNKPLPVVERQRGRATAQRSVQSRRDRTPPGAILHHNADLSNLPVTTDSPPTRDTSVADAVPLTGDAKVMHEIKRLRKEMEKCMRQIKDIQHAAKQDAGRSMKLKYSEDIEEARKKKLRADEQTTRSSRMIYVLNQQVKDIQADIDKMQGHNVKPAKKSQTMSKLAAAHRGTVKVLQNFVSHLPDYDLKSGMPRNYQEIGLLLRQLSLCCAQLEVTGQRDVPDSVMVLIKDMADLNKMIDKGLTGSSPERPKQTKATRSRSPSREPKMADRKKEVVFGENDFRDMSNNSEYDPRNMSNNSAFTTEKLEHRTSSRDLQSEPSTEREVALRRGIQSLLQAADSAPPTPRAPRTPRDCDRHPTPRYPSPRQPSPHDVPPLNLPVTPRGTGRDTARSTARDTGRGASGRDVGSARSGTGRSKPVWETLMQRNRAVKKGLLLPHHLQRKSMQIYPNSILKSDRERTQRRLVDLGEAHYAQATHSSRLKLVRPEDLPRSRDGSPVNSRRALMGSPVSPRRGISKEEVAKQVWEDRQRTKSDIEYLDTARRQRQKVEDVSFRLGKSPEWVAATERRIRSKIEPLISQAEVEVNADLLSEMILKDMVDDVAGDVYGVREDRGLHNEACTMQDLPSLETLMQRLSQMEEEQLDIRRRWATVVYDDDHDQTARTTYYDAGFSERPGSPLPIHLTRNDTRGTDPVQGIIDARINTDVREDGAIMFTKTRAQPAVTENLQLSRRVPDLEHLQHAATAHVQDQAIYLYLTREIVSGIEDNKEKFEQYLKKMNFQTVGRFNPQRIVNEIADEIMADCMQEVSKELLEVNNDIVEHTYKSEFKDAGLPTSPEKNHNTN